MKIKTHLDWQTWLRGMWVSAIQGGTTTLIATAGLLGGNLGGADVRPLDYKQIGGVFLGSIVVHLILYLNSHALPNDVADDEPDVPLPPKA